MNEYSDSCLNHFTDKFNDNIHPDLSEFIIENGFNIYILINYIVKIEFDDDEEKEEDDDIEEILNHEKFNQKSASRHSILAEISALGMNFQYAIKGYWAKIQNKIQKKNQKDISKFEMKKNIRKNDDKHIIREVLTFFSKYVSHIEICRDNSIQRIFFPILPLCKMLPKQIKNDFNENVNRINTKIKVEELMASASFFIKIMKHEEKLRIFFNKNKFIGIIANREKLWKQCAFYVNLTINFIIIVSYTSKFVPENATQMQRNNIRLMEPFFFERKEFDKTLDVILALGTINLVFGSAVVILFLIKKAPLIIDHIWIGFFEEKMNNFFKIWKGFKKILISFYICLNDLEFFYYIIYIIMNVSGLGVHPFFFVFNLTDFLRIDQLKNVVKAVWIPRKQLLLTLFLFILVEYYFSLIGYLELWRQYDNNCDRFWMCFMTTFDQTFKVFLIIN